MSDAIEEKPDNLPAKTDQKPNEVSESKSKLVPTDAERAFQLVQRKALLLSESDLVPKAYQKKIGNCVIAIDLATRTGMDVLMVMQNLHIIQGKPSWSSTYVIAAINSSGRFSTPLNFEMKDDSSCVAYAIGKDGQKYEGPEVNMVMAKAEGWIDKSGSKWKTMPALMLRYRSAAFFGRLFTPELMLGMHTEDEVIDMGYAVVINEVNFDELMLLFIETEEFIPEEEKIHIERILKNKESESYKKVFESLKKIKDAKP